MTMAQETLPEGRVVAAQEDARRATRRAEVHIRRLCEPDEVRHVLPVLDAIWGASVRPTPDLLRALAHAGTVLLAAEPRERPGEVCGFVLGFLGWAGGLHLHSHQLGVLPAYRTRGVGYALKLAERAACLEHGVTRMRWTFDPLLARNAAFNFGKLGTVATAYEPDFYGRMADAINGDDTSDRFEVSWRLDAEVRPRVDEGPENGGTDDTALITVGTDGMPRRTGVEPRPGTRVPVPTDYDALRRAGHPIARAWRQVTGAVFAECFDAGLIASAFGPRGYLFTEGKRL